MILPLVAGNGSLGGNGSFGGPGSADSAGFPKERECCSELGVPSVELLAGISSYCAPI